MGIKSWLFGDDRSDGSSKQDKQQQAIATLKKQLNSSEVQGKNLKRKSDEQKQMAKQMLKDGNKIGAKQALTRSQVYLQKYNKIQNMSLNLQSQVDVIQETKDTSETVKALKISTGVVKETLQEVSALDVERTMAEMEDQRDQLEMMSEALSDTTAIEMGLDVEFTDNIDEQLAAMELELQSETIGDLPQAGVKTTPKETEKEEPMNDLEEELEALQKELDGE